MHFLRDLHALQEAHATDEAVGAWVTEVRTLYAAAHGLNPFEECLNLLRQTPLPQVRTFTLHSLCDPASVAALGAR